MKNKSLRRTLLITYISLLFITLIPSIYSVVVSQIHTNQYSQIISNVGIANRINLIAKNDIPYELWNIICGKKAITKGNHNVMLDEISSGLSLMLLTSNNADSRGKLEVANRAATTLRRNVAYYADESWKYRYPKRSCPRRNQNYYNAFFRHYAGLYCSRD